MAPDLWLRPLVLGLVLAVLPGCIPVAMFPSEHRVSGGLSGGMFRGSAREPVHDAVGGQFTYRASIAPLAMVTELWDRDFDFDLGYLVMAHEGGSLQHGPTASLSAFAVRESLDGRPPCTTDVSEGCAPDGFHNLFRLAFRAELDVRFSDPEPSPGIGGRLGLRFDFSWLPERAAPVVGATTSSGGSHPSAGAFAGVTWGEGGIAIDLLAGGGLVGSQAYGELVVGLTFRVPAIAGILLVIP